MRFFSILADEDAQLIPLGMTNDCVAQTWYRFLRTIGNPTALCSPHIISKSSHFVQWALTHDKGAETYQHPCLQALPLIFLKAIKGISSQVDAFLGKFIFILFYNLIKDIILRISILKHLLDR